MFDFSVNLALTHYCIPVAEMEPEAEGISPKFTVLMRDVEADEGTSAKLDCRVSGFPKPEVKWYHGTEPLVASRKFVIEESEDMCILTITKVTEEDAGTYRCVAKNLAGEAACSGNLRVERKRKFIYLIAV